jgi:hypothetical protein
VTGTVLRALAPTSQSSAYGVSQLQGENDDLETLQPLVYQPPQETQQLSTHHADGQDHDGDEFLLPTVYQAPPRRSRYFPSAPPADYHAATLSTNPTFGSVPPNEGPPPNATNVVSPVCNVNY